MFDQQLMGYFNFDQTDLQANRNGQYTEKQKARLLKEDKRDRIGSVLGGGFLLLIGLVGLAIAIAAGIADPDWGFRIGFGFGFGCVWPLVWGGLGISIMSRGFSKFQVKLMRAMGPVNILKVERTSSHTDSDGFTHTSHYFVYELHVGGKSFDVKDELADIIMQGDTYAFYYTEGSENEILSAELLSKA
ncbi:MAG TPA: hypothetical protein VMT73_04985 [Anaerolineales bacterium]|nr:hypothetical protein [Anaerolineales bacterium]